MIRIRARIPWKYGFYIENRPSLFSRRTNNPISFKRSKIWTNPLSRFNPKPSQVHVIEDDPSEIESAEVALLLQELHHYTKSQDVPSKLRHGILSSKLSQLIALSPSLQTKSIARTADLAFLQLYELNNKRVQGALAAEDLAEFYVRLSKRDDSTNSKSLAKIAQYYISEKADAIPQEVLLHIIVISTKLAADNLRTTLTYLLSMKKKVFTEEFTAVLLEEYEKKGDLNSKTFSAIIGASESLGNFTLLNDAFYKYYLNYIDSLFENKPPQTYEYRNLERDIDQIQIFAHEDLVNSLQLATSSLSIVLKVLQHICDLQSINPRPEFDDALKIIRDILRERGELCSQFTEAIFKENLGDEELAFSMIDVLYAKQDIFGNVGEELCSFINKDDVKFSEELRLLASLQLILYNSASTETSTLTNHIDQKLKNTDIPHENYVKIYERLISFLCVTQEDSFGQDLSNYFRKEHAIEPSVLVYKHRLDRAIGKGDFDSAIGIFDESVASFTQWDTEADARVLLTLSRLVVLLCESLDLIEELFPLFRKIKQQIVSHSINAHAVKAIAEKMLRAEYVGDLIETMKRELPPIDRDDMVKLPTSGAAFLKYRELFDFLHNFVITYTNEETYETNWVLYGELHKYFIVPYESYLPAMKFFSEHNRSNASLIIFRQLKKLSELHGEKRHLPPLRDMYFYLFRDFGDKLYEDGVQELHEYFKLDLDIPKQDIQLQNCILNAYSNLQDVTRAKDLFISMSSVPKQLGGINEETVQIMLKTYTYNDMMYVQRFWNDLSLYGILPNHAIFKQYIIAHVYHGLVDDAFGAIEEMSDYGVEFSSDILLSMHNYCLETTDQEKVKKWALENHEEEWKALESKGVLRTATNYVPSENLITDSNKE